MAVKGQFDLEIGKFNAKLAQAEANVKRSTGRMRQESQGVGGALGGMVKGGAGRMGVFAGLGPAGAALAGTAAVGKLAMDSFNAAMERESLLAGLAANSTEDVATQLARLKELAQSPGLGMNQVLEGSTRLQAVGMSATDAEAMLREMGNALALVGKGKADMDGVILALTQIASKGKISAQEINQLAERLPQIRTLMQGAFGTSDTEALQKMGVSATDFFAKITTAAQDLERAQITTAEQISNMGDAWLEVKVAAGEAFLPLANEILPLVKGGLESATAQLNFWNEKLEALGALVNRGGIKQVTKELEEQVAILRERQAALGTQAAPPKPGAGEKIVAPSGPDRPAAKEKSEAELKKEARDAAAEAKRGAALEGKLDDRRRAGLVKDGDVAALKKELDSLFGSSVGMFPDFDKSAEGLERLMRARLDSGNIEGAEEAMAWLEDAAKLQEGIKNISEKTAQSLADLRETAASGAFDLLDPKQQAAEMKRQLGESLGIDIQGLADVERGLKGLRAEAEELRALGDTEGEKKALERLTAAQDKAKELAGLSEDKGQEGVVRRASGGVANAVAQIFGRASADDAMLDVNRSQLTEMRRLKGVLEKIEANTARGNDVFTDF